MDDLWVCFLLSDDGFLMNSSPFNGNTSDVYIEFMSIFGELEESNLNVSPTQVATVRFKSNLWTFIDKYKDKHPVLNKLKSKIDSAGNDSYFFNQIGLKIQKY